MQQWVLVFLVRDSLVETYPSLNPRYLDRQHKIIMDTDIVKNGNMVRLTRYQCGFKLWAYTVIHLFQWELLHFLTAGDLRSQFCSSLVCVLMCLCMCRVYISHLTIFLFRIVKWPCRDDLFQCQVCLIFKANWELGIRSVNYFYELFLTKC